MIRPETKREDALTKDRTTGLILFGVLEILLGVGCALLIPLTVWAAALSASVDPAAAASLTPRRLVPGLSLYALGAAVLIWLGVGSVRARRWAAALWPVVGWVWLATGVVGLAMSAAVAPGLRDQVGVAAGVPDSWAAAVVAVVLVVTAIVLVALPGILIRFYGREDVRATCERRNPRTTWTDACPQALLSLSLVWAFGVYCLLLMPFFGSVVPWFGLVVHGLPGAVLVLLGAVGCVWLTVATFCRDRRAWSTALAAVTLASVSTVVTILRVPPAALVEPMGLAADEAALILGSPLGDPIVLAAMTGLSWAGFVIFLVAVRHHFEPTERVC